MRVALKKKVCSPVLLVLLGTAPLAGLLHLRAAQDDAVRFAQRNAWQRPAEVMDELGIKSGSVVADVGSGSGYFTFELARRVGPIGKVYAEDVDAGVLRKIQARRQSEHLDQVETIQGTADEPELPAGKLDAILITNAYHEMKNFNGMLRGIYQALKPGGVVGIIDREAEPGQPRPEYQQGHRIPAELVREDLARNGFHFLRRERGFESSESKKKYYFLIFEKPRNH